jgi:23S rRNA (pseudouridine1915-N3)-methyltransferase
MNIKLICVGKIKEKYLTDGIEEYRKRLKAFCDFEIIELKEVNTDDINKNIESEGDLILSNIKKTDHVIALSIPGKNISSESLAQMIKEHYTYNSSVITFIIGGSNGLDKRVLDRSNYQLSFGKMTYPHQLMRMILLEQVYRCMMINNNHKYHK